MDHVLLICTVRVMCGIGPEYISTTAFELNPFCLLQDAALYFANVQYIRERLQHYQALWQVPPPASTTALSLPTFQWAHPGPSSQSDCESSHAAAVST